MHPLSTLTRNMSLDTFNDVLDAAMAESNDEVDFSFMNNPKFAGQETSADPAMSKMFQFGSAGAQFDRTSSSSFWSHPNSIENGTFSDEKSQSSSSIGQNLFADGDQKLTWPGSATPSDHTFIPCASTTPKNDISTEVGVLRVGNSQNTYSNIHRDVPLSGGDEVMNVNMGASVSEMELSTDLSQEDPSPFDPHASFRESTQSGSASEGWTYRQILEIVALPPPEGLHLWQAKVSQLATDLGMPSGATGKDVVHFVLHVASRKNELHRVMPLVKALAAAARVLEGRIVAPTTLLPVVLALYPSAGPLGGIAAVGAELNDACERHDDEITSECEEEENLKGCDDNDHDGNDNGRDAVAEAEAGTEAGDTTFRRPSYKERDLYCRVGDCLRAFKNPWTCIKHPLTHFSVRWVCPGPCHLPAKESEKTPATSSTFTRADSFRRHLLNNPACVKAVLETLNMEELPESGTGFLTPFLNGPDRQWEGHDYQLTDLKSVKEAKMKLRNSDHAA